MKFKLKSFTKKFLAILMLHILLTETFLPTIAYALTSGPTAPEATSFEPIDTTDMVNPLTGDFTYNMPLLEVPGPEGGYPLSLSYHAGILPNEEASWVGLGWTLNPGAITRNVNGFADDFNDVNQVARQYWAGGSRSTFGLSVGLPVGVSFGLSFSQDTYQGFGVGASIGFGVALGGKESPFGIGFQIGTDGYGGSYAGVGLSVSTHQAEKSSLGLTGTIGISTNFETVGTYAGAGVSYSDKDSKTHVSLIGASISSGSSKASLTVGGGSSSVHNANAGKIQTESSGFGFTIPLPGGFSVGLSHNYTRYWADNTSSVLTQGTLYMPNYQTFQDYFNNRTTDIYRLTDHNNYSIATHPDPDQLQGGTFPSFDDYSVTAQGLSGNMRPYIYQANLYSQNIQNTNPQIVQTTGASDGNIQYSGGVQYRFINDFSNSYRQESLDPYGTNKFATAIYGNNDGTKGYNINNGLLAGSKHIRYFTNSQINGSNSYAKTSGFIDTRAAGFTRMGNTNALINNKGGSQIGGFMITNVSGVTYHYALPAYSYNEHTRHQSNDGTKFTSQTKNEPYAYTWYLTAITGPDFIDRNNNGLTDEQDWGYWITFDYGKWTDNYNWRNPSEGFHNDIENGYKSFSSGQKEIYYLDAIRTRSHTAIFVKEVRADGKGSVYPGSESYRPNTNYCGTGYYDEFGYEYTEACSVDYPRETLALKKILLFSNYSNLQSLNDIRQVGPDYNPNIIDITDIDSQRESSCLRAIKFNHNYSLAQNTPNSYDLDNSKNLGKLTLFSINFLGKGGAVTSPAVEFEYDLDPNIDFNKGTLKLNQLPVNKKATLEILSGTFQKGDIIKYFVGTDEYFSTVLSKVGNTLEVLYLGIIPTTLNNSIHVVKTKNPPYNKDAVDIWGMYKSDYVPSSSGNQNLSKLTTEVSNTATDVWCLRKIHTALGADININYEGDTYSKSVLNNNLSLIIDSFVKINQTTWLLNIVPDARVLTEIFKTGDIINFLFMQKLQFSTYLSYYVFNSKPNSYVESVSNNQLRVKVHEDTGEIMELNGQILTGNLKISGATRFYGGGIRVRNIDINDLKGNIKKTNYFYNYVNESNDKVSSGITSYEPLGLDMDNASQFGAQAKIAYRKVLYMDMNYLLTIAREVPAPGVMYEYVTVEEEIQKPGIEPIKTGKSMYQYRVFNKGMIGIKEYSHTQTTGSSTKNLAIKNYTSQIGNLLRVVRYDNLGNKLTETINHFNNDDMVEKNFGYQSQNYESRLEPYNYQGVVQERYGDYRSFGTTGNWFYKVTMSARDQYPIIQTGTTQIDYKNGTQLKQEILAHDFYSGAVTRSVNSDSYGNRFLNEVIPAYTLPAYEALGLKTHDYYPYTHKHMLTQEAANYTYKLNAQNEKLGLLSGSVQTWGNDMPVLDEKDDLTTIGQSTIWRKKASYSWMTDGTSLNNLTPFTSFVTFDFSATVNQLGWKKLLK